MNDTVNPRGVWFYRPSAYIGKPISFGSDEWNRTTIVIGFGFTGQIVIPIKRPTVTYDRVANMAYISIPVSRGGGAHAIKTKVIAPNALAEVCIDTGEVLAVEVSLSDPLPYEVNGEA